MNLSSDLEIPSFSNFNQFREFLETYNKITEVCFGKCVQNLNRGSLYDDEVSDDLMIISIMFFTHCILTLKSDN